MGMFKPNFQLHEVGCCVLASVMLVFLCCNEKGKMNFPTTEPDASPTLLTLPAAADHLHLPLCHTHRVCL
jgi:hypothetical protein